MACFLHAQILCVTILLILVCRVAEAQDGVEYPPCNASGITLNGTFGRIASPNYPSILPDAVNCRWIIQTSKDTRIAIRFERLLEEATNHLQDCYNYIILQEASQTYDADSEEDFAAPLQRSATGSGPVKPMGSYATASNTLEVIFVTDAFVNMAGFSFNWTAVDRASIPDPVSTVLTSDTGTVTSPNYPNLYGAFLDYTWIIKTSSTEKYILLEFESEFGLEKSNDQNCPYDRLVISEGDSAPSSLSDKLEICSTSFFKRQLYKSSAIYVTFKSDSINSGIGFSFNYTAVDPPTCSEFSYQNGTAGVVSTPQYPLAYKDFSFCKWLITVPSNMRIAIRFNTPFSIVSSADCSKNDYLALFDGPLETDETQFLAHSFCGEYPPRGFLSSGNQVLAVFRSQDLSTVINIGFSFNWTAEEPCQSDQFQCWDGTCINSAAKCNGVVDCPQDIADEASCPRENPISCGIAEVAPTFKWDARILGGHEASKGSWPWQGYIGELYQNVYYFLCGAVLIDKEWALSAAHCMRNRKGLTFTATFGDYNLTDDDVEKQNITIDGIFINKDYNATSNGFTNGTDLVLLHLSTPVNITKWVKPACLPQSPPPDGENLIVTGWGIKKLGHSGASTVEIMRQVRVNVLAKETCNKAYGFTLSDTIFCAGISSGGAGSCEGDSGGPALRLTNSSWEVAGLSSFASKCGEDPAIPTAYTNVYTLLPYINNVLDNGMTPVNITNFVISGKESGEISSPNYGKGDYPQGLHIRWHVTGPKGKRIEIRFDSNYSIELTRFGDPCAADYMYMYDGSSTNSLKHGNKKLCGTVAPTDFLTTSNNFIVEFYTDYSFQSTGFSLTWNSVDSCAENEMRCWNQSCIPAEKKCDGVPDCPGSEDEFECGVAEFGPAVCGRPVIAPEFPFTPLMVGGHNSREGSWPWQIALKVERGGQYSFSCGGSLISEEWAMTAAHCIFGTNYQVVIGEYDLETLSPHEKTINVTTVIYPPEFDSRGIGDIALLKLAEKVDFSSMYYQPICLPSPGDIGPPVNTTCVITGWGVTGGLFNHSASRIMQQTHVRVLNDTVCSGRLEGAPDGYKENYICTGLEHERSHACIRDSGGPLACFVNGIWVAYGVASFFVGRCGQRTYYQNVTMYLDYIEEAKVYRPCSGLEVIEASSGDLKPPIISGKYDSNVNCTWLLKAPEETIIQLQFKYFDLQSCPYNFSDYVHLYDGNSTSAGKIFDEPLCGNRTLGVIESTTNQVLVTFVSDSSVEMSGFHIIWEAKSACSKTQFRCWDGSCVEASLKCDGKMDCSDQSDEKECTREGLECGKQEVAPEFLWSSRIAGSSHAINGSWPFQALVTGNSLTCGGTILNELWILTSATCVDLISNVIVLEEMSYDITVSVGVNYRLNIPQSQQYGVTEVHKHGKFDVESTSGYDIAVLKLNKSLNFDATVQPACLATPDLMKDVEEGEMCVILGWGYTHPGNFASDWLRQTRVPVLDPESCKKFSSITYDDETMICTGNILNGGPGACDDHGGPLMCFRDSVWVQCGVISAYQSCGLTATPDYYTNVSYHTDWIEARIGSKLPVPIVPTALPTAATTESADTTITSTMANVTNGSIPIMTTKDTITVTSTGSETTTSSSGKMIPCFSVCLLVLAIQSCIAGLN